MQGQLPRATTVLRAELEVGNILDTGLGDGILGQAK